MLALARELRDGPVPRLRHGQRRLRRGGERLTYSDRGPFGTAPPDPAIAGEVARILEGIDELATTVEVLSRGVRRMRLVFDGQTLRLPHFDIQHGASRARSCASPRAALRGILAPRRASCRCSSRCSSSPPRGTPEHPGTFERNFNTRGGAQRQRLVGGSQPIALRLAAQLGSGSRSMHRCGGSASPARGVTIVSDASPSRAKRVIVAVPPALAGRIDYEPILPFERDQLTQRYGQGTLTKVAAVYDRPFWRDAGLTGFAVTTGFPISPDLRRFAAGRPARGRVRLRRWRQRPPLRDALGRRRSAVLKQFAASRSKAGSRRTSSRRAGAAAVDAGMPGGDPRVGLVYQLRPAPARAARPGSIGPAPRPRRTGTGTWTVRSAPVSGRPPRWREPVTAARLGRESR